MLSFSLASFLLVPVCDADSISSIWMSLDEMRIVKDGKHGMENPEVHGGWDGIVGGEFESFFCLLCCYSFSAAII